MSRGREGSPRRAPRGRVGLAPRRRPAAFAAAGRFAARVGAAAALCGALSCKGANVPVGVRDPDNVLGDSTWAHVLVFEGSCPPLGDVVLGAYGAPSYEQIAAAGGGFDEIGSIEAGRVGFALVARSDTCQVVGVGCTNADLREVDRVDIVVGRVYDSSARTACGAQCVEGQCAAGGTESTSAGADATPPL